jgi:hypothetical protein
MKKILQFSVLVFAVFLLHSCTIQKPLYYWGNYSDCYYKYIKKADDKATERYRACFIDIFDKSKKLGIKVPPGIYAEYGQFMLKSGNKVEAKKYFELEMQTYPESKKLMMLILANL